MSEETKNNQDSLIMNEGTKKEADGAAGLALDVDEMVKSGVFFGHKKSKRHPKMKPYIFAVKNNIDIIDIQQAAEKFKEALEFLQEVVGSGGKILFVGTKIQAKNLIKELADTLDMPHVNERWLGGFLTNFQTMIKRIDYFNEMKKNKESGEFEKYTKKEKIKFEKELRTLEEKFGGVAKIKKIPEAIFILDFKKDIIAAKEAKKVGVPVVAVCDTDTNLGLCDWPILANDDAISSIKYILDKVKEAILNVRENKTT